MIKYSEFRPTGFDPRGLGLRESQEWFVAPCSHNRDSGPMTESNWESQLKALGGESDDCQVHRFGHWGPGWFEIVLINPLRIDLVKIGEELEASLEDYPLLDEQDCSRREWDDYVESWQACGMSRELIRAIAVEFSLLDSTRDAMEDFDADYCRELYQELLPSGDYYETCDNGANFGRRVEHAVNDLTRDRLARFIRDGRKMMVA